ncbi:MAG: FKBP-type peptidyl-prolyl cis-trans isomerase N-terminal domain-containing protein, partial [Methylococcaceae bacterium]|nr:FKBP-type peptidyl-prolyl cis-trans isomerase N-terminal domain-containing protein [Methylococcaceae bacterium]
MFSKANATTPAENKAAGEAFLAENAKKPGVV